MTAKTSSRAWRWLGCWSVAWWQWLIDGGDAGGVHPVRLADGRSGGVVGQGGALLRCGVVQRERGSEADWPWPRADGLAGVDGLAGGYATGEVALTPEPCNARHHWSGSSRSSWSTSLSALGALDEVERSRREVLSDL
jgi:hypothetical protein